MISARSLTQRQTQVLILVVQDVPLKEIAVRLGISVKTVEYHWLKLRKRTGIKTPVSAIYYAVRHDIVEFKKSKKEVDRPIQIG